MLTSSLIHQAEVKRSVGKRSISNDFDSYGSNRNLRALSVLLVVFFGSSIKKHIIAIGRLSSSQHHHQRSLAALRLVKPVCLLVTSGYTPSSYQILTEGIMKSIFVSSSVPECASASYLCSAWLASEHARGCGCGAPNWKP